MYGIIYKATNIVNGKVYIGKTKRTLKKRKSEHAFMAKVKDKRTAFQIAILEHGGVNAFKWEQIDTAETEAELNAKEKHWIAHYKADNPQFGYNIFEGGIGAKHTPETRRKISEANKGRISGMKGKHLTEESRRKLSEAAKNRSPEILRKISESLKGKPKPEEHRRKLSEAHKGKTLSPEHRQKMSEAQKGRKHTEETKRKISAAQRGEKHHSSKLTDAIVRQIKTALAHGETCASLGRKYGVTKAFIGKIKLGQAWKHIQIGA